MQTLAIPRQLIQNIYAHAQQNTAQQQGGVILTAANGEMRFQALLNTSENSQQSYLPSPAQLASLDQSQITAVVYSQPVGDGTSQPLADFRQHWVVSLNTKGVLELYVWDTSTEPASPVPQYLTVS